MVNKILSNGTYSEINDYRIPEIPADASSKTYVLKVVNGTFSWVEDGATPTPTPVEKPLAELEVGDEANTLLFNPDLDPDEFATLVEPIITAYETQQQLQTNSAPVLMVSGTIGGQSIGTAYQILEVARHTTSGSNNIYTIGVGAGSASTRIIFSSDSGTITVNNEGITVSRGYQSSWTNMTIYGAWDNSTYQFAVLPQANPDLTVSGVDEDCNGLVFGKEKTLTAFEVGDDISTFKVAVDMSTSDVEAILSQLTYDKGVVTLCNNYKGDDLMYVQEIVDGENVVIGHGITIGGGGIPIYQYPQNITSLPEGWITGEQIPGEGADPIVIVQDDGTVNYKELATMYGQDMSFVLGAINQPETWNGIIIGKADTNE